MNGFLGHIGILRKTMGKLSFATQISQLGSLCFGVSPRQIHHTDRVKLTGLRRYVVSFKWFPLHYSIRDGFPPKSPLSLRGFRKILTGKNAPKWKGKPNQVIQTLTWLITRWRSLALTETSSSLASKNWWLEEEMSFFGPSYFQGLW